MPEWPGLELVIRLHSVLKYLRGIGTVRYKHVKVLFTFGSNAFDWRQQYLKTQIRVNSKRSVHKHDDNRDVRIGGLYLAPTETTINRTIHLRTSC